jgi:hypothetical protein
VKGATHSASSFIASDTLWPGRRRHWSAPSRSKSSASFSSRYANDLSRLGLFESGYPRDTVCTGSRPGSLEWLVSMPCMQNQGIRRRVMLLSSQAMLELERLQRLALLEELPLAIMEVSAPAQLRESLV